MNADQQAQDTTLEQLATALGLQIDEDAQELYGFCPSCQSELIGRLDGDKVKLDCSLSCAPRAILGAAKANGLASLVQGAGTKSQAAIAKSLHDFGLQPIPLWNPSECFQGKCSASRDGKPCTQSGKHPMVAWKEFTEGKRASLETTLGWWKKWPHANLGLLTGAAYGIAVLDCDDPAALELLEKAEVTSPLEVKTGLKANGWRGRQFIYKYPSGCSIGSKAKLTVAGVKHNLDARGDGGLVVFVGSQHRTGVEYEKAGDWPKKKPFDAAPLFPIHLFDAAEIAPVKKGEQGPAIELDADELDVAATTARLKLMAWGGAIAGDGGDSKTYRAACLLVRDYAIPDDMALSIFREWNQLCKPPWADADLLAKLASAKKSGKKKIGEKAKREGDSGEAIEQALATLENLAERAKADPSILKDSAIIDALVTLKKLDSEEYDAIKKTLQAEKILTKTLDRTVKARLDAEKVKEAEARKAAQAAASATQDKERFGFVRPTLTDAIDMTPIVDGVETLLCKLPPSIAVYQRARQIVTITKAPIRAHGIARPDGALSIEAVSRDALWELSGVVARWKTPLIIDENGKQTGGQDIPPPQWPARLLLARPSWKFDLLTGIVECPTLVAGGQVLSKPGFDPTSGLFASFKPEDFPPVPESPTLAEARAAIVALKEPLQDFPFVAECDRSAMLAALLTPLARNNIAGHVPLLAIRATCPGTGKSYLADIVSIIATGRHAPRWAPSNSDEEDRKRLLSVALAGDSVLLIDNASEPLGSPSLDMVLTGGTVRDRVLGASKIVEAPWRAVLLATGNNLQVKGDLARRVVPIDLDAVTERPEERSDFAIQDILRWTKENRGRLVSAALTLLRAYITAGAPKQKISAFGSFEDWSDLVRSCLVWAGEVDPCAGRHRIREASDPMHDGLRSLLLAWAGFIGYQGQTLAEVLDAIDQTIERGFGSHSLDSERENRKKAENLQQALGFFDARFDGTHLNAKRVGNALRKHAKRVVDGLRMVEAGKDRAGIVIWKVEVVGVPGGKSAGSAGSAGSTPPPYTRGRGNSRNFSDDEKARNNHKDGAARKNSNSTADRQGTDPADPADPAKHQTEPDDFEEWGDVP